MTTDDGELGPLTAEQSRRAAALGVAREVLAERGPMRSGPVDAMDLYYLAVYVDTGTNPWEEKRTDADADPNPRPWEASNDHLTHASEFVDG